MTNEMLFYLVIALVLVIDFIHLLDIRYLKKHFDKILEACMKGRENNA